MPPSYTSFSGRGTDDRSLRFSTGGAEMTADRIAAVGAYVPRGRIDASEIREARGTFAASGVDRKAVPAADEDALTMAAAASERALSVADMPPEDVAVLAFATTTPPLAESEVTARLGSALGVPPTASTYAFTDSTRAGTRALTVALDASVEGPALVVAADCPRGEPDGTVDHAGGAGAAAFVVADEGVAVRDRATHTIPYPGTRFRPRGDSLVRDVDVRQYGREAFVRPCVEAARRLDAEPSAVAAAAIQSPDGDLPKRVADSLDVADEALTRGSTVSTLGDTGAASVPLGVARALEDDCERVLALAWGSGAGADALVLEGDCPVEWPERDPASLDEATYRRWREADDRVGADSRGAYVSVPSWQRSLPQRHRLVAGSCPDCGALAFPPSGACRDCGALVEYDPVELPRVGTVETATSVGQGYAPPEFASLQASHGAVGVVIVRFELHGETVSVPLQVAAEAERPTAGDDVRTVLRHLYTQDAVPRYARKVEPVSE